MFSKWVRVKLLRDAWEKRKRSILTVLYFYEIIYLARAHVYVCTRRKIER